MSVLGVLDQRIGASRVCAAMQALAARWGYRLESRHQGQWEGLKGLIVLCPGEEGNTLPPDLPTLSCLGRGRACVPAALCRLRFTGNERLPSPLRGASLLAARRHEVPALPVMAGYETLATVDGRPVWGIRGTGPAVSMVVSTGWDEAGSARTAGEILNGETFLDALPVAAFLAGLADDAGWHTPPLRACLQVDDPNLRRNSYGCIRYDMLLGLGKTQPFHVALATIPLDGGGGNRRAVGLFRDNPRVLSLLVHGNDHQRFELAQPLSETERSQVVSQSLARIRAIEHRTGLEVDRVMAPPHGVCSREMMESLWQGGYEAMATNRWSLWKHNPPSALPADFGLPPADWLAGGLPVLSRFRFNSAICANEVYVAALLGKPIIPYGHHSDFADNMVHVQQTVAAVNALGLVQWMSSREILETNFESRRVGDVLSIRLYSRRARIDIPDGVRFLQVFVGGGVKEPGVLGFSWSPESACDVPGGRLGESVPVILGSTSVVIRLAGAAPSLQGGGQIRRTTPAVRLRRFASEVRDRIRVWR